MSVSEAEIAKSKDYLIKHGAKRIILMSRDFMDEIRKLIDEDMMIKLDAYRAFRHVFVHGYAFHLRWDRMKPAAEQASVLCSAFRKRVKEIIDI